MSTKQILLDRLHNREACIGIVGLGYVGLPLAVGFAEAGFTVIGLDVMVAKVEQLNRGESYIPDVPSEVVRSLVEKKKFRATTSYADLAEADAISICVPTPLRKTKDPDMSYIIESVDAIAGICRKGMLIVLESTTYPGTTTEIIVPRLAGLGFEIGEDVFVAFSPERIDPGNAHYGIRNTPKVVGGVTDNCNEVVIALYEAAIENIVSVSSPTVAEMVKLLENTFRAVNIGLVNEMALMCDKLHINVWEVIEAASSKPYGFMPFYPGPGLGGHCIPVDPHYLGWKLKTLNYTARFIELAGEVNTSMPVYVLGKISDALNDDCKSIREARIVVMGVAFKRNIDDVRESPALDIITLLRDKGANVAYHDPHVARLRLHDDSIMENTALSPSLLEEADAVVIVTDHSLFDWQYMVDHSRLIVDTRNATSKVTGKARVVSL